MGGGLSSEYLDCPGGCGRHMIGAGNQISGSSRRCIESLSIGGHRHQARLIICMYRSERVDSVGGMSAPAIPDLTSYVEMRTRELSGLCRRSYSWKPSGWNL